MKKCPFCAEEIQDDAVKCKHCHEFLDESKRPLWAAQSGLPAAGKPPLPWYFNTSFIVVMFLSLPPLALPSIWLHPRLHVVWKLAITVVAAVLCWLAVTAFRGLMSEFEEATKMLNM